MRQLSGEAATHIFFSVGAFFSVNWVVGSALMAACTLVYISARSSASKPSVSSPLIWAWYFSVFLPLETFLW
jgi:hypothetical protein